jgi:hypothetical protein
MYYEKILDLDSCKYSTSTHMHIQIITCLTYPLGAHMGAPKGTMKVTRVSTEKSRQISKDISLHDKTAYTKVDRDVVRITHKLYAYS